MAIDRIPLSSRIIYLVHLCRYPGTGFEDRVIYSISHNICFVFQSLSSSSEQLTYHLNGKKHLAKEKQHILNIMKGEDDKREGNAGEQYFFVGYGINYFY